MQGMNPQRLAIVSPLVEELRALLAEVELEQVVRVASRDFHLGRLHGHDVVLVLSGIGKVATAATATLLIERFAARAIVITGVAGGVHADVQVGDVVVADAVMQHDMDCSPLFPRFEIPMTGVSRFACDAPLREGLFDAARRVLGGAEAAFVTELRALVSHAPTLRRGLIVSGDRFVSSVAESQALRTALPEALAVEMEGGALGQVCADAGVPCAVLRVVSDRADDSAHVDFPRFLEKVAARASHDIVSAWLQALAPARGRTPHEMSAPQLDAFAAPPGGAASLRAAGRG
jgi:adenosylhomocysteine nucleosidase